ncbi:MAG: RNA polymerase factor sigma-54 [Novosphingobium sp.]
MALGPRLDLRQSQSLVMTPQLQQAIKLLALSNLEVEGFLAEALAANPLLEVAEPGAGETASPPDLAIAPRQTALESSGVDRLIGEGRGEDDRPLDIDRGAIDSPSDTGDGGVGPQPSAGSAGSAAGGSGGDAPSIDQRGGPDVTLAAHLHAQVGAAAASPAALAAARWLIDQLDEAGYLTVTLDEAADALGLSSDEAAAALALVQSLDPTGVGARSLAECLALQAHEADRYDPCMARLLDHLDLVAKGAFAQLKRLCSVDDEDLAEMLVELRGYDPKPGSRFGGGVTEAVQPDILVRATGSGWDITLNPATLPRVLVNRSYYLELRKGCTDKAARGWLGERLTDANWLVKALDQRQKTILKVAAEIIRLQDGFFRGGVAQLRPLTLRTVAEAIAMHESTVSRATANKYLHCARGTFELKYFFTSGVASTDGAVSAEAVKAAIRALVEAEEASAVLSDDALVDLLRRRGFDLARRTVAKYREAIGIGSSVQRRRRKALEAVR